MNVKDFKVGDAVVSKPQLYFNRYKFYRIKKQTPKMVVLEELKDEHTLDFPPTGPATWVFEHIRLTNEVIHSFRVKKETLFSDYELYDPNKTYKTVYYDD